MTLREIRELLPLYAAGSLSVDEKEAIEEELSKSTELQEELRFWRQARATTLSEVRTSTEYHPTVQEIVSYARGELRNNEPRLKIESHVQTCQSCSQDLEAAKQTYLPAPVKVTRENSIDSMIQLLRRFKASYAIPILLTVIICVIVFWPEPSQVPPPGTSPEKRIRFTLYYELAVRDPSKQLSVPSLTITDHDQAVDFTVFIPHSGIDGVRYSLDLVDPRGMREQVSDTVMALRYDETLDTLNIGIRRAQFTQPSGLYLLHIMEKLPPNIRGILPEEYAYQFELVSRTVQ